MRRGLGHVRLAPTLLFGCEQLDELGSVRSVHYVAPGRLNHREAFSGMEPSSSSRLARLISEVRFAATQAASRPYTADVRGLRLNLDFLRTAGASDAFLRVWEVGVDLRATPATPRTHRNHPSLGQHSVWAERVWNRLEKLGKVAMIKNM